MDLVVDANILIAIALSEPEADWIRQSSRSYLAIAPLTLPFEVANALAALARRNKMTTDRAQLAYSRAMSIPVALRSIDVGAALRLSCEHKIYAYDGFVLQCAMESAAGLLTLDRRLRSVAKRIGIDVKE